jgi:hypothetical protein
MIHPSYLASLVLFTLHAHAVFFRHRDVVVCSCMGDSGGGGGSSGTCTLIVHDDLTVQLKPSTKQLLQFMTM